MRAPVPLLLLSALVALAAACRTAHEVQPLSAGDAAPRHALPARAWELREGGRVLGFVVQFRGARDDGFFSVRNAWQQDLGLVDELGRAWRFEPHADEARWLGSGTVLEGARSILGAGAASELVELPLHELGAGSPEPPSAPPSGPQAHLRNAQRPVGIGSILARRSPK